MCWKCNLCECVGKSACTYSCFNLDCIHLYLFIVFIHFSLRFYSRLMLPFGATVLFFSQLSSMWIHSHNFCTGNFAMAIVKLLHTHTVSCCTTVFLILCSPIHFVVHNMIRFNKLFCLRCSDWTNAKISYSQQVFNLNTRMHRTTDIECGGSCW